MLKSVSYYVNVIHPVTWVRDQIIGIFPGILLKAQENRIVPYRELEIDVAWIQDGELNIGECKTNGYEFTVEDVNRYTTIAPLLRCQRIVFATSDDITNIQAEVRSLAQQSPVPIEFLTSKDLFDQYQDKAQHMQDSKEESHPIGEIFEDALEWFLDRTQNVIQR